MRHTGSARSMMFAFGLSFALAACAATGSDPTPPASPSQSTSASASPTAHPEVTLGVYGPSDELAAWSQVAEQFNATSTTSRAKLQTWPDHDSALAAIKAGTGPDVFLASRRDLDELVAAQRIQPVGELLDDRNVDFGDGYERTTLLAFGRDNALQCMPFGSSPRVIYYNTELVDFARMSERGLPVPEEPGRWNFEQFTAAAEFAARPARGIRAFYFEPTLSGLAPFLYAAGANMFDDDLAPTRLALSSDDSQAALELLLPVLRKADLSPSPAQLLKRTPLEWFLHGKLAMIAGDHALLPTLRKQTGLSWDVMPFPAIDQYASVGDMSALCMSATASPAEAADLIVHAISAESVATIANVGYLLPTNLAVVESDEFLTSPPATPRVFNESVPQIEAAPSLFLSPELERAAIPGLNLLLTDTLPNIPAVTAEIDASSQVVLTPQVTSSESPSP